MPTSRRLLVKKKSHTTSNTVSRFGCIILVFAFIVIILCVILVYFATKFKMEANTAELHVYQPILTNDIQHIKQDEELLLKNNEIQTNRIYNKTRSILIRTLHESSINLDAEPFLVGLGAEKSGSTSMGAALFNSGEFLCPLRNEIDVETKYWTQCTNWDDQNDLNQLIETIIDKKGGHCSIKQYLAFKEWRAGKVYKFEKSVDYLGLPYIAHIYSELFVKPHKTKIFIMIRYPPPRISSTWKFFVGEEKNKMPEEYGNVEKFTKHLLKNEVLMELIGLLDRNNGKTLMQLDWKHIILPKWNEYMQGIQEQCKKEAKIVGFKSEYCNPTQLLRRAVGLSCSILPIMQWIHELGIKEAINSFRIIQSELYFEDSKEMMDRLICWSKIGTINKNKCNVDEFYKNGKIKIKKLQSTHKSKDKISDEFSQQTLDSLHTVFDSCNARLFELLTLYPQLALKEFNWDKWHYKPF